ncbi:hypothetical protein [Secundilactobacillus kimchicus]|uniref:hypothetical protein n=1 Tax=Secundilactobacillus kimchicus TaxID=528209 RepID=UPI000A953E1F|nr:hypothetical protein [Secundilactobacillus kimchicus]
MHRRRQLLKPLQLLDRQHRQLFTQLRKLLQRRYQSTRVQVNYTVTKNGKKYAAVDASRLSYKLQKQAGSRSQLDVIASNLKKVATPASDKLNVLYKGAAYTTATKAANAHKIKVTTDGYVQYFANSVKKSTCF